MSARVARREFRHAWRVGGLPLDARRQAKGGAAVGHLEMLRLTLRAGKALRTRSA